MNDMLIVILPQGSTLMKNRENIRLLITGGSGFIGTNAIDFAGKEGLTVVNFEIRPPQEPSHQEYWTLVDIRERENLAKAVEKFGPTHIWHLAAMTGMD